MESQPFRVLIVGGSVAGLTLANMLEQSGVDYLVLEKCGTIAPNLGASIATAPNGARILDQLGCYDALVGDLQDHEKIHHSIFKSPEGIEINRIHYFTEHLMKRHGYGFLFVDRQRLVRTLYDNIKDKSKILVNQGVHQVEQVPGGVKVHTQGGDTFSGNLLIGADGVHSAARKEMWRIADAEQPGYFDVKEREPPTDYSCCFGTSTAVPGLDIDSILFVQGEGFGHLLSVAPGNRVFWFIMYKNDKKTYGLYEKLPRYTDKDLEAIIAKHLEDNITETVKFKMLWDRRTMANVSPLPEYVMSKWHYGRIMTVGDAVHKYNPISGQGGNSAFETCAVLTNLLHTARQGEPRDFSPSDEAISRIFEETTSSRRKRAIFSQKLARIRQKIEARDGTIARLMSKYVVRFISLDFILQRMSSVFTGAHRLEMLEMPEPVDARVETFNDERNSKGFDFKLPFLLVAGLLVALLVGALEWAPKPVVWLEPKVLRSFSLSQIYNISPGWFGLPSARAHAAYSLAVSFPLNIVIAVESSRYCNRGSFISWPSLFAAFGNMRGWSVATPLYYIFNIWSTSTDVFSGRAVPTTVAQSLLSITQLIYVLGACLALTTVTEVSSLQRLVTLWPLVPLFVDIATFMLARVHRSRNKQSPGLLAGFEIYSRDDLPHLPKTYRNAAILGFLVYAPAIAFAAYSLQQQNSVSSALLKIMPFVRSDLVFTVAATLIFAAYHIFELRRRGLTSTRYALLAFGLTVPASIVMGPGSALAALWWWREGRLAAAGRIVNVDKTIKIKAG